MGRTRMKTTPIRDDKLNMISTTISNMKTQTATKQKHDTLKKHSIQIKQTQQQQRQQSVAHSRVGSTIIVHAPKRTNSISSLTSTNSIISDEHSKDGQLIQSPQSPQSLQSLQSPQSPQTPLPALLSVINEAKLCPKEQIASQAPSPTPSSTHSQSHCHSHSHSHSNSRSLLQSDSLSQSSSLSPTEAMITDEEPSMAELTANAIETLNAGLKSRVNPTFANNRKIFMITEKSDNAKDPLNIANAPKRKMFLILEDKHKGCDGEQPSREFDFNNKRMTLFTDKDSVSPNEIQEVLPFLIDRIKAKIESKSSPIVTNSKATAKVAKAAPAVGVYSDRNNFAVNNGNAPPTKNAILLNGNQENYHFGAMNAANSNSYNEKVPLTLPPKKNRNKIVNAGLSTTGLGDLNGNNNNNSSNSNSSSYNNHNSNGTINYESNGQLEIDVVPKDAGNCSTSVWTLNNNIAQFKPANFHRHEREHYDLERCRLQKHTQHCNGLPTNGQGANQMFSVASPHKNNKNNNISSNNNNNNNNISNNNSSNDRIKNKERKGATTVIVSAGKSSSTKLNGATNIKTYDDNNGDLKQKNINLSPDFLFLMKMLPKLEGIPEPTKSYVKNYIEETIEQNTERQ